MKISFDYDSTLSTARIQAVAKKIIDDGHDVWITTSRMSDEEGIKKNYPWIMRQNAQLREVVTSLGISLDKIQYTNHLDKWNFLDGFDMHFDDDDVEIELIEENLPTCAGILILTQHKSE